MRPVESQAPRVMHLLPDLEIGGGQMVVLNLVRHLQSSDGRHIVCAIRGGALEATFRTSGIPLYVAASRARMPGLRRPIEFIRIGRAERINLVHTNNTVWDRSFGQIAARVIGVPVVNTFHSLSSWPPEPPRSLAGIADYMLRWARHASGSFALRFNVEGLVAVSDHVRASYAAALGVPRSAFRVVPPGLPASAFAEPLPDAERRRECLKLGIPDRSPIILSNARLVAGKGQRLLVDMVAALVPRWPRLCLLLAGDGPARKELEQRSAARGLQAHVKLLGDRTDVTMLLRLCDVFASGSEAEGFGLAVLEAMAAGKPVVALATSVSPDLILDGESGLLVRERDPEAMARRVGLVLENPELGRALGAAATIKARAFGVAIQAGKLIGLYREILDRQGMRHRRWQFAENA